MWSMPRSVLRVVAVIIALCALTGLVLGIQGAPDRGRLPGETTRGNVGATVDAPDAKPLIEEIPPPPQEKKKPEDEMKKDEVDPDASATAPVAPPPSTPAAKPGAADDRVGDLLDGVTPPPQEDPPH
jgi:hypothetical protein